jgi:hypothetical protein
MGPVVSAAVDQPAFCFSQFNGLVTNPMAGLK